MTNLKDELEELDIQWDNIDHDIDRLRKEQDNVEFRITDIIRRLIIDEKIVSGFNAVYSHDTCECIVYTLKPKTKETGKDFKIDKFVRELYHWSVPIDYSEDKYSDKHEIILYGDDGEYTLKIKNQPEIISKWFHALDLKMDVSRIENSIRDHEDSIKTLKELLDRVKI